MPHAIIRFHGWFTLLAFSTAITERLFTVEMFPKEYIQLLIVYTVYFNSITSPSAPLTAMSYELEVLLIPCKPFSPKC